MSADSRKENREIVSRVFQQLLAKFPAWKQATVGDPNEWAKIYKRQLGEQFVLKGIVKPPVAGEDTEAARQANYARLKRGLDMADQVQQPFLPKAAEFARWCKRLDASHREFDDSNKLEQLPTPKSEYPARCAELRKAMRCSK